MTTTIQWSVDCEGEELSAWSHQRPAWCAISIAVVADDRESAWQKVAANGWQRVTDEVPYYEVCPGCMKALLEAGTARWMTNDGEKQLVLREPWIARAAGNSQQEISQVMAANTMITDLAPRVRESSYELASAVSRSGTVVLPNTGVALLESLQQVLTNVECITDRALPIGLLAVLHDSRVGLHLPCNNECAGKDCTDEGMKRANSHIKGIANAMQSAIIHAEATIDAIGEFYAEVEDSPVDARTAQDNVSHLHEVWMG